MNRYLLFNAGCGSCSGIAGQVEKETDGILVPRSLAELEIQQLLNDSLPDWEWEPMLMEVSDSKEVKVYTGVMMRLRLIQLLGISKAAKIASIVYQSVQPAFSVQERRRFLRFTGGAMAGLAVLGLNPLKSGRVYALETPNTSVRARELTGRERADALNKTFADALVRKFTGFLNEDDFAESRTDATAYSVESQGYPTVLMISVPFYHKDSDVTAHVKHFRYSGKTQSEMGVVRSGDGQYDDMHVHEVVDDVVKHTKTLKIRDGEIVEEPVGQSRSLSRRIPFDPTPNHDDEDCHTCLTLCGKYANGMCSVIGLLGCIVVCLPIGTLAYPVICGILNIVFCEWYSDATCPQACGPGPIGYGYCDE